MVINTQIINLDNMDESGDIDEDIVQEIHEYGYFTFLHI